jgi:enoyl-CoA hydratase/carnithine racemase
VRPQTTTPPTRSYAKIRVANEGAVCTITLFYPDRRNAIGPQMVNELLWAIADAHDDETIRVIVITGHGTSFCAGGDFSQMTGGSEAGPALPYKGDFADLLLAMSRTDKPIVAKVNGHAMGGGLGLVAASTFAIAADSAQLGTPEINVGLFPMMIMPLLLRLMPRRHCVQMMLLGEKLSAQRAVELGLLNECVAPEELDQAVREVVDDLLGKSPLTLKLGLRALSEQDDMDMDLGKALPVLRGRLAECLATDDAREGLMAFLQKRTPNWTGK